MQGRNAGHASLGGLGHRFSAMLAG